MTLLVVSVANSIHGWALLLTVHLFSTSRTLCISLTVSIEFGFFKDDILSHFEELVELLEHCVVILAFVIGDVGRPENVISFITHAV